MKLSIIVPVYNVEKYLANCVQSIIAQGLADYEIILVNDGSTDNSKLLCDKSEAKHPSLVKVIHQANGGLSSARNRGIEASQGEYITFIDSDDELCINTLKGNLQYLIEHPDVDMLEYPAEVHADSTKGYHLSFPNETQKTDIFADWIRREGHLHCYAWNKIYRAHLWSNTRFPIGEYYEDTAVMPQIIKQCNAIHYSSHGCYRYIMHEGTITTSYRYDRQRQLFVNSHQLYMEIKDDMTLHTESLKMWIYCLNLLIDMGRCSDVDKTDYNYIVEETNTHHPTYRTLLKVAPNKSTYLKLLPLRLIGLKSYCSLYVALTPTLKV